MIKDYIAQKKSKILDFFNSFFPEQSHIFSSRSPWANDAFQRLETFMGRGKMLRGTLVFLGYDLIDGVETMDVVRAASAIECFQSGFLIHDDIMDGDAMRRGQPSLHKQYETITSSTDMGEDLAMCVGDMAFFLGFRIIASMDEDTTAKELFKLASSECMSVALGQMHDLTLGHIAQTPPSKESIYSLYAAKTGWYSTVLPLLIGMTLAKSDKKLFPAIETYGMSLGIAFQLTDDNLNIFGHPTITGKSVGSDISGCKNTFMVYQLLQVADEPTKKQIHALQNKESLSDEEIRYVQSQFRAHNIDKFVEKEIELYKEKAFRAIEEAPLPDDKKILLREFGELIIRRIR